MQGGGGERARRGEGKGRSRAREPGWQPPRQESECAAGAGGAAAAAEEAAAAAAAAARAGGGADACSWVAARGAARRWRAARGYADPGAGLLNSLRSAAGLELRGGASAPRTWCPKGPHSKLQTEASRLSGPDTSPRRFAAASPGVPKAPAGSAPPGSPHPPTQLHRTATAGPRQTPPGSRLRRT